MTKKPISPNSDHSNKFVTVYIPQNFAFTYAYVATPLGAYKSAPGHTLSLLLKARVAFKDKCVWIGV